MIKKPAIASVRQIQNNEKPMTVKTIMRHLGSNSGNMIFAEALNKVITNNKAVSFQLTDVEISECDAVIFAAANWLNPRSNFGHLADRLEKTNLPVFAVGLGAQSSLEKEMPQLSDGTLRFLRMISERSKSISTRGVFSSEVLEHYGIKNSVPTGCPSLLLTGRTAFRFDRNPSLDRVTVHGTRHGFHLGSKFHNTFYKKAYDSRFDILLQSETADIIVATGDDSDLEQQMSARQLIHQAYAAETEVSAISYIQKHGKFFTNYESWIEYMKSRTFCVGTRIHGTIASLVAGTPAVLIAHDSRTLELAQIMGVPYATSNTLPQQDNLVMDYFVEIFKKQAEQIKNNNYVENFATFFKDNGITAEI